MLLCAVIRSCLPKVFYKKGVVKNFTKFIRKHLCWSLFFNQACNFITKGNFITKETPTQVFSCEFYEVFKSNFFIEYLWGSTSESYTW